MKCSFKSIGFEWFLEEVVPIVETTSEFALKILLHTAIHHICDQISPCNKNYRGIKTNGKAYLLPVAVL